MSTARLVLSITAAIALLAPAHAGIVIRSESRDLRNGASTTTAQEMRLEGNKLMMQIADPAAGGGFSTIFRGDVNTLYQVQHDRRSVTEIDGESLRQVGQQVNSAMQQMQERLAGMPPEQRAMLEKLMKGSMPQAGEPAAPAVPEIRPGGEKQQVDGVECRKYEIYYDGSKTAEIWAAPWAAVGLHPNDFEAIRSLSAFYESVVGSMGNLPFARHIQQSPLRNIDKLDAYPMLIRRFEDGAAVEETRLGKPERRALDAAQFELPAGYTVSKPGMMR